MFLSVDVSRFYILVHDHTIFMKTMPCLRGHIVTHIKCLQTNPACWICLILNAKLYTLGNLPHSDLWHLIFLSFLVLFYSCWTSSKSHLGQPEPDKITIFDLLLLVNAHLHISFA